MAQSYSHTFGELVGDFLEASVIRYLSAFVARQGFYLDYKHARPARHGKKEVIWRDGENNAHRLDIVIEEDGSEQRVGTPRAFIEVAWRTYTKHSKNKVQEISGAILPLITQYRRHAPFYAAVLAGEFTGNTREQLASEGFTVCHLSRQDMEAVFQQAGLSVCWNENTAEETFRGWVERYQRMDDGAREAMYEAFVAQNAGKLEGLVGALRASLARRLEAVVVIPTHGAAASFGSACEACAFVEGYDESASGLPVRYYEIIVRFNTGEEYACKCPRREQAEAFLATYR